MQNILHLFHHVRMIILRVKKVSIQFQYQSEQLSQSTKLWRLSGVGEQHRERQIQRGIVGDKNELNSLSVAYTMGHRIIGLRWQTICGGVSLGDGNNRKATI